MKGLYLLFLAALILLEGCYNPEIWEPSGKVTLLAYWQETQGVYPPGGEITLKIENTGKSYISSSTVLILITTNLREYYLSPQISCRIPPGKSYLYNLQVAFSGEEERTSLEEIEVIQYYFE